MRLFKSKSEKLNEAEQFHFQVIGVRRRFHKKSIMGQMWLKIKNEKDSDLL